MKKRTFYHLGLVCLAMGLSIAVSGASTSLRAQQPTAPTATPSTLVAVVDITKLFEAHPTFKANMKMVEQQLKVVDEEMTAKQKELRARSKQLSTLSPSSADYRRLETELARQLADLKVKANQTKKDFMQREALQYYNAYSDIVAAVHKVAEQYNISLVFRFDSTEIDPKSPQSVAQGISRSMIIQRNLDITQLVVNHLAVATAQKPGPNRRN